MERNFRILKTAFLQIRPIFLRKAARTKAHGFIAMLAFPTPPAPSNSRTSDLQTQVSILQQQIQRSVSQQAEQAKIAQGLAEALKGQVTAQSDLEKAEAQGQFAKHEPG